MDRTDRKYFHERRYRRRHVLGAAGAMALGAASLALVGCGDDDDDDDDGGTTSPTAPVPTTAATSGATVTSTPEEEGASEAQMGGSLIALGANPSTLDPTLSGVIPADIPVYYLMFDNLFNFASDLTLIEGGGLAREWEQPDDLVFTMALQDGVKFHDGTDLDAESIKFHYDRILAPDSSSTSKGILGIVERVEAVDPRLVQVTFNRPFKHFPGLAAGRNGFVVSPAAIESLGDQFGNQPVGSGPFRFKEWISGDHLTVERNEEYWKEGVPYLDSVVRSFAADEQTMSLSLRSGEADIASGEGMLLPHLSSLEGSDLVVETWSGSGNCAYFSNPTKPPFDVAPLRKALLWAIDREELLEGAFYGYGQVGYGFIEPFRPYFDPSFQPFEPKANLEKARQFLEEGGMPDGFEFTGTAFSNLPPYDRVAEILKAQVAKVGITMNIELQDSATASARTFAGETQLLFTPGVRRQSLYETVSSAFLSSGFLQLKRGSILPEAAEMDRLIEQVAATDDEEELTELYREIQVLQNEIATDPTLFFFDNSVVASSRVRGFEKYADGHLRLTNVSVGE